MRDPYLYSDIDVMRNVQGIRSQDELDEIEKDFSGFRVKNVDVLLTEQTHTDFNYLKEINHYLLQDVYEWAGELRTIDMWKSERVLGGESVEYAHFWDIQQTACGVLAQMEPVLWEELPAKEQAEQFSACITKLWQAHPFREGNTRTTMVFAAHYALTHGFSLDRDLLAQNAKYTRAALAIATVSPEYGDKLTEIMQDAIERGDQTYFKTQLLRSGFMPTSRLVADMRKVNQMCGKNVSIKGIRDLCRAKQYFHEPERELLSSVEHDFKEQELAQKRELTRQPPQPEP